MSAAVRTALLNDPELGLRPIAVESHRGIVTLSGSVRTADEAQRAQRLAGAVRGVREVRLALKIEPDFRGPASASLTYDREARN